MTISAYAIPGIKDCNWGIFSPMQKAEIIIGKVCRFYDVPDLKVRSKRRTRQLATARMFCMYFIRLKTTLTLQQTADIFNGRDHTTTIHAVNFIKSQISMTAYSAVKEDYLKLIQII